MVIGPLERTFAFDDLGGVWVQGAFSEVFLLLRSLLSRFFAGWLRASAWGLALVCSCVQLIINLFKHLRTYVLHASWRYIFGLTNYQCPLNRVS